MPKAKSAETKGERKVHKVMKEFKEGDLKSGGSGKKVASRKQAVAIALSEARESGAKIPKKKASPKKTASPKKKTSAKTTAKSRSKSSR